MPSPVNKQYIISDKAAPRPVKKPDHRPLFSVRCIHKTPIGPIGADTKTPIASPRIIISRINSILTKIFIQITKIINKSLLSATLFYFVINIGVYKVI